MAANFNKVGIIIKCFIIKNKITRILINQLEVRIQSTLYFLEVAEYLALDSRLEVQ